MTNETWRPTLHKYERMRSNEHCAFERAASGMGGSRYVFQLMPLLWEGGKKKPQANKWSTHLVSHREKVRASEAGGPAV